MSTDYVRVQWTQHKKWYDIITACFFLLLFMSFIIASVVSFKAPEEFTTISLLIRGFGICSIFALHIILAIGPLARLDNRFLPLLYNRRHLGVMTFFVASVHAFLVVFFYHSFGALSPATSLLTANAEYQSLSAFPFEFLGLGALFILFALASTSHDFWQKYFGKTFWKSLHMLIYLAYFLVVGHVLLGVYQSEKNILYSILILSGILILSILHILAGLKSYRSERTTFPVSSSDTTGNSSANSDSANSSTNTDQINWIKVAHRTKFLKNKAKIIPMESGESVAVYKHEKGFSAVTNVCAHQGGPLGEGKIIDGCITCPWHGWQYRPEDGQSPPPFEEKIATYPLKIEDDFIYVSTFAKEAGTFIEPVK